MKVLGRFNPLDFLLLLVLLISAGGFAMAQTGHAGVDKVIESKGKVSITVYFAGLKTRDPNLFKVGEQTALTIRNQPVEGTLTIENVKECKKQISFLTQDGTVKSFDDPSQPLAHDYEITISSADTLGTADGYVVKGQKIKIGNPIELEAKTYRVQGTVVDIR